MEENMNIAICDDEKNFRSYLKDLIVSYFEEKGSPVNIFKFDSGEALLKSSLLFDFIFLDVEMGKLDGISAGLTLKKRSPHSIIIVITSHNNYLDDAFKINAFRFLSKPINVLRLYKALDDASELINREVIVFYDMNSKQNVRIYSNDIIMIETERKKTRITTVKEIYYSRENITFWKSKINSTSFVCPHSSYYVNLDYSISHNRKLLVLAKKDENGYVLEKYEINIAPSKQAEIKEAFFNILEKR